MYTLYNVYILGVSDRVYACLCVYRISDYKSMCIMSISCNICILFVCVYNMVYLGCMCVCLKGQVQICMCSDVCHATIYVHWKWC